MSIDFPVAWAAGFTLALARCAAFVAASPVFARAFPAIGRVLFALAGAILLAAPLETVPTVPGLVAAALANVVVGLVLAFVSGLVLYLFDIAGEVIDISSGLGAARIIDPITNRDSGVLVRLFQLTAMAVFFVVGGDRLIMAALARSADVVALDGAIHLGPSIGRAALAGLRTMLVAGLELAAPALAALIVAEVALAVASRFLPQTNVFLLGLPVKLLVGMATLGAVLVLFPTVVHGAMDSMLRTFTGVLRALAGA